MILFFLFCTQPETTAPPTKKQNISKEKPFQNFDKGQKHPPLPENNPIWDWDAKDFVPDYGWFGEHSWMDVRMRVAGHLSAAGRDKARIHAQQKDWKRAAEAYQSLANILKEIPSSSSGTSKEINTLLLNAAQRDAVVLSALAQHKELPETQGTLYPLRMQYFRLVEQHLQGKDIQDEIQMLKKSIDALPSTYPKLDITSFQDFHSRHALRIRLFEAYLDALDPLSISEWWGYWTAEDINRQKKSLILSCDQLLDNPSPEYKLATGNPLHWPGQYIKQQPQPIDSSVEEFGALPTGDSLIDIGSSPGPKAIGDLMKWGLDDVDHMRWLSEASKDITTSLSEHPQKSVQAYQKHIAFLEKAKHGSRFYNVKQLRNATVRQLARSHHYQEAHLVLQDNFPLHNQDWACPNREGILLALDGRLLALDGDPRAEETLSKAIQVGTTFLRYVDEAEKGVRKTPVPPIPKGMKLVNPPKTPNHRHDRKPKSPKPPRR